MARTPTGAELPFTFDLPPDLIASHPPVDRDGGRLLVVEQSGLRDCSIQALLELVRPEDLLVLNDTRVLPARIAARRATGGAVELLLLPSDPDKRRPHPDAIAAMVRSSRKLRPDEVLRIEGLEQASVELLRRRTDGTWWLHTRPAPEELMSSVGRLPLPPYLGRSEEPEDRERYQTVYARNDGAVAAPTAGLHFTDALLAALLERGVGIAMVTLHVGLGTFRPLRAEDIARGRLHSEWYEISTATVEAVRAARAAGGRIIAVGTTATRALEAAADVDGSLMVGSGWTDLFIRDGYRFRVVDRLLTNFHLPGTSLLALVGAFAGRERMQEAYRHAVARSYRFFSYGDACWLTPGGAPSALEGSRHE
ncbi:MAG: tRNA preQ1(34) S-adenosylmethionine ribosyltransferase-isomerase QueA [Myxococcota bacterium]|nr:tRNA preQ1(34) S-adenosylmethionine ribosyltransferase-isomerase QueA [Myxococcota bacterium]